MKMTRRTKAYKRILNIIDGLETEGYVTYSMRFGYRLSFDKFFLYNDKNNNKIELSYDGEKIDFYKNGILVKSELISVAADGGDA